MVKQLKAVRRVGRNDLCLCGSKKKFKKCCGSPERISTLRELAERVKPLKTAFVDEISLSD